MDKDIFSYNINVNYSDVDEDNELTNKGVLRLLQEVAGIHSGLLGYGVNDIPKTGIAWILLNWKLKVFSRPHTSSPLIVKTWIRSENPLFFYRDFSVYDENNNLVALASSKWVLFDINKKSITKIPEEFKSRYSYLNKFAFEDKWNEKIKEPEDSKFVMNYIVQRRDIDTNHHVNNLYYLDYAIEALPEDIYNSSKFSNVEIMYKHEAKIGDTLSLFYSCNKNNEFIITIKYKDSKNIHTVVKMFD